MTKLTVATVSHTRLNTNRTDPRSTRVTHSTLVSWAITDGFVSLSSYYSDEFLRRDLTAWKALYRNLSYPSMRG